MKSERPLSGTSGYLKKLSKIIITWLLTYSRVVSESATGSTDSHRVRLNLTLQVTKVDFSPSSSSTSTAGNTTSTVETNASLQISGRVAAENAYVKMGAHHTLDVEMNRDVRIVKDDWDSISLGRVQEACVEGRGAEVGAIVCGEGSSAPILLAMQTYRYMIIT